MPQDKPASNTLDDDRALASVIPGAESPEITFSELGLAARTSKALEDMAYRGLPLTHAAKKHQMRPSNLQRAFNSPRVRAVYNQIVRAIRENAGQAAYLRIVEMSVTAQSDHVKLQANTWIAGVDNIAPVKRVEGRVAITHTFGGFEFPDMGANQVIDAHTQDKASGVDRAQVIDD